jgi:signal transduction protein with GAF and PtsI domain
LDNLGLLNAIGRQLRIAITNAQLYEATRSQTKKLAALNTVASVLNQPSPLQNIMDKAIAKVVEVLETDGGGTRILVQKTGVLLIVSSHGLSTDHIEAVRGRQLGDGIVGEVTKTGKPQV